MNSEEPTLKNGQSTMTETEQIKVERLAFDQCYISEQNTRILPAPTQEDIKSLALSIESVGQLTPGLVRPTAKGYEICAGARRYVACKLAFAGRPKEQQFFLAIVKPMTDDEFEEALLIENHQRKDPNPFSEARLMERLAKRGIRTAEQIAAHLGESRHWARRRMGLLKIIPAIRKEWENPQPDDDGYNGSRFQRFTVEMASFLGTLPEQTQRDLLEDGGWKFDHAKTLRELQAVVDAFLCRLDKAPFDLNDKRFFGRGCGPGCACDSSKQSALFDFEDKAKGRCLNPSCFNARKAKWQEFKVKELAKEHGALSFVTTEYYPHQSVEIAGIARPVTRIWNGVRAQQSKEYPTKVFVLEKTGEVRLGFVGKTTSNVRGTKSSKSQKERLDERKRIVQGKRWKIVHDELDQALAESKHTQVTTNIVDLVACFGLPWKAHTSWEIGNAGSPNWKLLDSRGSRGFAIPEKLEKNGEFGYVQRSFLIGDKIARHPKREAALWESLKCVLHELIRPLGNVGEWWRRETDLRRVAKLIKFPIDERKRAADLKVPPPKSWGKVDVHTLAPISDLQSLEQIALEKKLRARSKQIEKEAKKKAKKGGSK